MQRLTGLLASLMTQINTAVYHPAKHENVLLQVLQHQHVQQGHHLAHLRLYSSKGVITAINDYQS